MRVKGTVAPETFSETAQTSDFTFIMVDTQLWCRVMERARQEGRTVVDCFSMAIEQYLAPRPTPIPAVHEPVDLVLSLPRRIP